MVEVFTPVKHPWLRVKKQSQSTRWTVRSWSSGKKLTVLRDQFTFHQRSLWIVYGGFGIPPLVCSPQSRNEPDFICATNMHVQRYQSCDGASAEIYKIRGLLCSSRFKSQVITSRGRRMFSMTWDAGGGINLPSLMCLIK